MKLGEILVLFLEGYSLGMYQTISLSQLHVYILGVIIMLDFQPRKSLQTFGDLESCVNFHHISLGLL